MSLNFRPRLKPMEDRLNPADPAPVPVPVPVQPSFVVNTVQDMPDVNLADGIPQDALGHVSLRSVIQTINALPVQNPANTFVIEFANVVTTPVVQPFYDKHNNSIMPNPTTIMEVELKSQLPALTAGANVAIYGSTTRRVTITRDATVPAADNFRFMEVSNLSKLKLEGLKITNADNRTGAGGAIQNNGGGTLDVVNCYFEGNCAASGGAIYNLGLLTVTSYTTGPKSVFLNNGARDQGGAILTGGPVVGAIPCKATVELSTFTGNVAGDIDGNVAQWVPLSKGGAIAHIMSGELAMNQADFVGNKARDGGAVYTDGKPAPGGPLVNVTGLNCKFEDNSATNDGGAVIIHLVDVKFTGCEFKKNTAGRVGAAIRLNGFSLELNACVFGAGANANKAAGVANDVSELTVPPGGASKVTANACAPIVTEDDN